MTPELTAEEATRRALDAVSGSDRLRAPTASTLVVYGEGVSPTLAWHVVVNTAAPAGEWHVMVDADTGTVLAQWDELRHATGSGQVYSPNAVQQTGNTALRDNGDVTNLTLDAARVSLPLAHLDDASTKLRGTYVDVTSGSVTGCTLPYTPGTASEPSRTYNYDRSDDRFEEATVYAAIDGVQSWFRALGVTNANNRSIPVDVHCIPDDNSYFSSSDNALHFGDGGVDDGEDAEVVVHEYGHAVQANQVPGWGPSSNTEQRAMGEGFSDFLTGMYYVNSGDPGYLANYRYCIAEWDATSYNPVVVGNAGSGCLRWINGRNESTGADVGTYGGTPVQEHNDGRFWSATLTCIYEGMGATPTARGQRHEARPRASFRPRPRRGHHGVRRCRRRPAPRGPEPVRRREPGGHRQLRQVAPEHRRRCAAPLAARARPGEHHLAPADVAHVRRPGPLHLRHQAAGAAPGRLGRRRHQDRRHLRGQHVPAAEPECPRRADHLQLRERSPGLPRRR